MYRTAILIARFNLCVALGFSALSYAHTAGYYRLMWWCFLPLTFAHFSAIICWYRHRKAAKIGHWFGPFVIYSLVLGLQISTFPAGQTDMNSEPDWMQSRFLATILLGLSGVQLVMLRAAYR